MRADFRARRPVAGGPGRPGRMAPVDRRRSAAGLFAGPPGGSAVFRAYRYGPDYPGLAGKDLKPGKTVEELQPKEPEKTKDSGEGEGVREEMSRTRPDCPTAAPGRRAGAADAGPGPRLHRAGGRLRAGRLVLRGLRRGRVGAADVHHLAGAPAEADALRLAGAARRPGSSGSSSSGSTAWTTA